MLGPLHRFLGTLLPSSAPTDPQVYCPRQISRPLIRGHSAIGPPMPSINAPMCTKPFVAPPSRERLVILLRQPEQRLISAFHYHQHMLVPKAIAGSEAHLPLTHPQGTQQTTPAALHLPLDAPPRDLTCPANRHVAWLTFMLVHYLNARSRRRTRLPLAIVSPQERTALGYARRMAGCAVKMLTRPPSTRAA